MVGARAGDQQAARLEQLQRPEIDLLISAMSRRDAVAVLGKSGGIENDHLEAAANLVVLLEDVEGVALAEADVRDRVQVLVALGRLDRGRGHFDALHVLAPIRNSKSKAALVAEAVKNIARRVLPGRPVVFALVEKGSRFLALLQRASEADPILLGDDFLGNHAVEYADALVQRFEQPHSWIVALQDSLRRKELNQNVDEQALQPLGSLAERLDYEVIAIAIHDQRREQVSIAVNDPVRVRVFDHSRAEFRGAAEAFQEERAIHRNILSRQKPEAYLGLFAVERPALEVAALVQQANHSAGLCLRGANVAAIDPEVPGSQPVYSSGTDDC